MTATANAPFSFMGSIAKIWLGSAYQAAHATDWIVTPDGQLMPLDGQMTLETMMQYSRSVADGYIDYLGTNEVGGKWPSWIRSNDIHWQVNSQFGMNPAAYGGTPLGMFAPQIMKNVLCPQCAP